MERSARALFTCLAILTAYSQHLVSASEIENFEVLYKNPVSILCEDKQFRISSLSKADYTVYWLLPSGHVVGPNRTGSGLSLHAYQGGFDTNLTVHSVEEGDFGIYHCLVLRNNIPTVISKSVNINGFYFGDLWASQYKRKVIAGSTAASVLIFLFGGVCLVHRFRYRTQAIQAIEGPHTDEQPQKSRTNPILDMEEISVDTSHQDAKL